jgi:hypothetical protein
MKNKSVTIWLVVGVLFLADYPALGLVEFKDGLTHDIDYAIADSVYVDYQTPSMYTTVNLLSGGSIEMPDSMLVGFEHSRINVSGGSIRWLESGNSSQVDISGGVYEHC